jgi:cysteinyl-tRNA synthetase
MKLYNTMSRSVEELKTLEPGKVTIYTCGLTVYSQPHIGNWVGYIYWDVLIRVLRAEGYKVERTQNITDVGHLVSDDDGGEDKMEKGAKREGSTAWDIAKKYSAIADHEAHDLLDLIKPDHLVSATSCIDDQIALAQKLDDLGYLYRIDDGMYFDTSKLDNYGKLAHLDIAGLEAGARVAMNGKKNPTDFAVWKFSPRDQKRDMEWESPWGVGFPGWHLECSTIAMRTLGNQIDIHTGGVDHIPVHHTNEIAQTESVTGKPFAQIWLHNNHIKVDGQKMSKSLGNIYTIDDIISHGFDLDAFKLLIFSKNYRTEGNFTWEILATAQNRLDNWRNVAALRHQIHDTLKDEDNRTTGDTSILAAAQAMQEALADNLDTVSALRIIDEAFSRIEGVPLDDIHAYALTNLLEKIDNLLGLHLIATTPDISDDNKMLIVERQRARDAKDYKRSDEIRNELAKDGIELRDNASGVVWGYLAKTPNID